jgi:hypothetical protein
MSNSNLNTPKTVTEVGITIYHLLIKPENTKTHFTEFLRELLEATLGGKITVKDFTDYFHSNDWSTITDLSSLLADLIWLFGNHNFFSPSNKPDIATEDEKTKDPRKFLLQLIKELQVTPPSSLPLISSPTT